MQQRVLVVEDDPSVQEVIGLLLGAIGMDVEYAADGLEALERFAGDPADLVILDLMLPKLDGFEVCRRIRERSQVPIVVLTAKSATADLVRALELGADDYVNKPFESPALLARIRAVLRRAAPSSERPVIVLGELRIDAAGFVVTKGGIPLGLSATEFNLLLCLAENAGRVLTREVLLDKVWSYDYLGDSRIVDMAVKRLRDKVEDDPRQPRLITTVRGVGYRMDRV